jgi:hypothetical protein
MRAEARTLPTSAMLGAPKRKRMHV